MSEFKEQARMWFDYDEVHEDSTRLFESMQEVQEGPVFLIAVGRGGWIPARILASNLEVHDIPNQTVSVQANYVNLGTEAESVTINQGLDKKSLEQLRHAVFAKKYSAWIIDTPYVAGKTVTAVRQYIASAALGITPFAGTTHWVRFTESPDAPWRTQALQPPDAYGRVFDVVEKPYVEYPWEYANLRTYRSAHE